MDYTVFDVETACSRRDSICSIGIIRYEKGEVVFEKEILINPETEFEPMNMKVHGITPDRIKDKPTFPQIWPEIKEYFDNTVLVAHNARSMDLNALYRTLERYNLPEVNNKYLCTYELSQIIFQNDEGISKYGLPIVCKYLGIHQENHHNALDDTRACFGIIRKFEEIAPMLVIPSVYSLPCRRCVGEISASKSVNLYSPETVAMQELQRLIIDIIDDSSVSEDEANDLKRWVENHEYLKGFYPFDMIFETVERVMEDNMLEKNEEIELLELLDKFINPQTSDTIQMSFEGKTICLSGDFEYGTKAAVEEKFVSKGAIISKGVTSKVDVLILGNAGSSAWKYGNYGSKYEKARQLQNKGKKIVILKEDVAFKLLK